jgi:uncharacterized protein (TIGR02246 family)
MVLGEHSAAQSHDEAATRKVIEARSRAFAEAYNRNDLDSLVGMYTADAVAFPPGSPSVRGRQALRELWQANRDAGVTSIDLRTDEVEGAGDLAIETGIGVLEMTGANGTKTQEHMKFVVIWKRDTDGAWRLHRDIWNGLPAPD